MLLLEICTNVCGCVVTVPPTHSVSNDCGFVAVAAFAAQLACVLSVAGLNVLLGIIPGATSVAHAHGKLHTAHLRRGCKRRGEQGCMTYEGAVTAMHVLRQMELRQDEQ